ncbi:hypothetical protein [Sphingomonas soli]|uniref:hypothetical protein n=1 Tax=Sphingomonas soli TaxID=266127 RepID=UPI00082CE8FB|nr:hypothetical protein [Sphingomonas soli]
MNTGILSQLYEHQSAVKVEIAAAHAVLAADPVDPLDLVSRRWALTRLLTGYQGFKHQQIFDPLARHGTPDDAYAARHMKIQCVAMGETFRAYLARWTESGIEGREHEYRREAKGMMALLERHILHERRGIEALLAPETKAA